MKFEPKQDLTKMVSQDVKECASVDGPLGYITKLPPNKNKLPDPDYLESDRCYVLSSESPELANFFATVRSICLDRINADWSLYYPQDIEKVKTNEWLIRRFMVHHKGDKLDAEDPKKTAETIIKALLWKKKNKVRDGKPSDYPREFYQIGLYGQAITPKGEFLIHCTASIYQRETVLSPHLKEIINIMIEQIDNELDGRRVVIFLDLAGVPLKNADIAMVYYLAMVALHYYRRIVKRCIVYEAPWYLSPFISMILAISPRYKALLTKVDRHNLFDVLSPEEIPVSLGGKLVTKFDPPLGCPSGVEYAAKRGISPKDLKRCLQVYGFDPA